MEENQLNPDVLAVTPSALRQFDHEISADPQIVKLTLGEPDFNVPEHIQTAAIRSIKANQSHYPYYWGIQTLREAASTYYRDKFGYRYPADQIICTVGATEGLSATFKALFHAGDAVLIPTPAYPVYQALAILNHVTPILIDTTETGCVLTPQQVTAAIKVHPEMTIKGVVITDPSNPTGVVYTEQQLADLVPTLRENQLWIISDEIYGELTYGVAHYSLSRWLPDQTIIINGLSKSHAMTGWRIGFVFGPSNVIGQIAKVHQFMVTTPTSIVQYAAVEALTNGQDDAAAMCKVYQGRRDYLKAALTELNMTFVAPMGAFYIFAKIPAAYHQDSFAFARQLARDYHVGVMPGTPFGDSTAIRISYASSDENLQALVAALASLNRAKRVAAR
jgi:aminotransferase